MATVHMFLDDQMVLALIHLFIQLDLRADMYVSFLRH